MEKILYSILLIILPIADGGSHPGTFFWKPRLGLDLLIPTEEDEYAPKVQTPNIENIREGVVVLVDGYQAGIAVISLAAGLSGGFGMYHHFNPFSAYFYNDAYRWLLRYFSLVPFWVGSNHDNFCDTTRVWRRRFFYMDQFIPKWLRYLFPYVKKEEWEQEEKEYKRFKKYSLSAFGKHFRFPNRYFNNFKSFETQETLEGLEQSSQSDD